MDNTNTIIIFLASILGIIILGKIFILPLKKVLKLLLNSILGGLIIVVINWIGGAFNIHIGLNVVTAIFVRNIRNTRSNTFDDF